jgi:dTDP-4-amino-4,6-dideoxygalactose transaminase
MTVFSFHPVKHLTTGEGGMVLTDDPEYDGRLRQFRSHGIEYGVEPDEAPWKYEMTTLGYNYRLSDVQCAIGLSQLKRLEANLARRREIAARYDAAFEALPGIVRPTVRTGAEPAWHFYAVRIEPSRLSVDRAVVFRSLRAENIGVQVHFIPVHTHPYYRARFDYHGGEYPVAEDAYERLITLPLFHGMSDDDAGDVIEAVTRVVTAYGR